MENLREANAPRTVSGVHAVAEKIAAADLNNLYLTSRFFTDPKKYSAFCAFYAVMRVVDDRIDDLPSRADLAAGDRRAEHDVVRGWEEGIAACYADRPPTQAIVDRCVHTQAKALLQAASISLRSFRVPSFLWENFFRAMHRDIDRSQFGSWRDFLHYAEGASVAPTTIYLFLLAAQRDSTGTRYEPPDSFDLRGCGHHLGIFAYLGHIVRDLVEDLGTGRDGLLYFAGEDMKAHGVKKSTLFQDLARGKASPETRALVAELLRRAREHLAQGRALLEGVEAWMEEECRFILRLIITIYERVIEKIESCEFDPMLGRHRLSGAEKERIIREVASGAGGLADLTPR